MTDDVIINFSPMSKQLQEGVNLGPGLLEEQHIEIFSVANFALSKKHLVIKRFVQNIVLLKKWFSSCYLENAMKNAMR